jgi:hypothetical protein
LAVVRHLRRCTPLVIKNPRLVSVYDNFLDSGRVGLFMIKRISSNFVIAHHRLSAGDPAHEGVHGDYRTEFSRPEDGAISQQ